MVRIYEVAAEMASDGMTDLPNFVVISSGITAILRLPQQQFQRLQCGIIYLRNL
jgi:hypothetical protein